MLLLNNNLTALGGFVPVIDPATGKITGYKTAVGGADTVFPFSSFEELLSSTIYTNSNSVGKPTYPTSNYHFNFLFPESKYAFVGLQDGGSTRMVDILDLRQEKGICVAGSLVRHVSGDATSLGGFKSISWSPTNISYYWSGNNVGAVYVQTV